MKRGILILILPVLLSIIAAAQVATVDSLLNNVQNAVIKGEYGLARNMVSEMMTLFPDRWYEQSKKMISINNSSGFYLENLNLFNEGHGRGCFYFIHPLMPEYSPYINLPGFDTISARDLFLRQQAIELARTSYTAEIPDSYSSEVSYPVILIFHGGGSTAKKAMEHWQVPALNKRFIKIYLQSYRHFDYNTFGWGTGDPRLDEDLRSIFNEIKGQYNIDTGKVFTAGISAGASAAIDISLRGVIPVKGFIAWCPDIPAFLRNRQFSALIGDSVRGYISAGEDDNFRPRQEILIRLLDSLNIDHKLQVEAGRGHDYPADENTSVNEALKFILNSEQLLPGELSETIEKAVSNGLCRGLSIALDNKETTLFYNYGKAFRDSASIPDQNTIYEIGSVTKLITCFIYANLVNEGVFRNNDRVGRYLPGIKNDAVRRIKISCLLTHTSGLPAMPDNLNGEVDGNPVAIYSENDLISYLNNLILPDSTPAFIYSNTGSALLGLIIEKATGKQFGELLAEYVTDRYNLNNTLIRIPENKLVQFADGSRAGSDVGHWDIFNPFTPAGGLRSSAEDLSLFLTEFLEDADNRKIRRIMERITPYVASSESGVAYGWFVNETGNGQLYWISGSTGGFSSFIGFNKKNDHSVVLLSNSNIGLKETGWKLLSLPAISGNGEGDRNFLLETSWGGTEKFNKYNPGEQSPGCHSTALSQICYYHRLQPHGVKSYVTSRGDSILEDYSSHTFNWNLFRKNIDDTTPAECVDEMALYTYYFASMLEKNFGTGSYQTTFHRRQIRDHLDCKVRERFGYKTLLMSRNTVKRIIRKQIDKACPVYFHYTDFGGNGHSIVIDGYQVREDGLWVHANFGWRGKSDGWYRYEKDCFLDNSKLELIITIEPSAPSN